MSTVFKMPRRDDVVGAYILERNAASHPKGSMAVFEDGTTWTWADGLSIARRAANALFCDGVRQGDAVAVFLSNGPSFIAAWLGIAALGATIVPVNVAFKGSMLEHLLRVTQPVRIISTGALAETAAQVGDTRILEPAALDAGVDAPAPRERDIELWDTHHIMLTSGTTGLSKAARCSHLHFNSLGLYGTLDKNLDERDVFLIDLPLFHTAALGMIGGCFVTRTPVNVRSTPNLRRYWQTMKETNATTAVTLSSMVGFLMAQERSAADTDHRVRFLITIPMPADPQSFMDRFAVEELITAYGGTEASVCMRSPPGQPFLSQSVGTLAPGYSARIVDENDIPVARGESGELIIRHEVPWSIATEYVGDPEATARAWRNGWYHTGDLFRQAEDGAYFFVDRVKDAIRRRGENISCFEVEQQIIRFDGAREVACVAVPSSVGADDELKAWIVPHADRSVDLAALVRHLVGVLPHFMVPRYFELTDALPKNPAMRVQKFVLRARGNTERTWDAELHGRLRVTSKGLLELGSSS